MIETEIIKRGELAIDLAANAVNSYDHTLHYTLKVPLVAALAPVMFAELTKEAERRADWDRRHEPQG